MDKFLEKAFPVVCWIVAAYFGIGVIDAVGFPPSGIRSQWPMLAAFGFFFVLPFVSKIDLFQLVSVERKLTEVKEKVEENKEKTKELGDRISQVLVQQQHLSNSVHTLTATASNSTASNTVNLSIPEKVLELARERVARIEPSLGKKNELGKVFGKETESAALSFQTSKDTPLAGLQLDIVRSELASNLNAIIEQSGVTVYNVGLRDVWAFAVGIVPELNELTPSFEVFCRISDGLRDGFVVGTKLVRTAVDLGMRLTHATDDAYTKLKSNDG